MLIKCPASPFHTHSHFSPIDIRPLEDMRWYHIIIGRRNSMHEVIEYLRGLISTSDSLCLCEERRPCRYGYCAIRDDG